MSIALGKYNCMIDQIKKNIIFVLSTICIQSAISSEYNTLKLFEPTRDIVFDYSYYEFDSYAVQDTSIKLKSFKGKQSVIIDSVSSDMPDTTKYFLTVEKSGIEIIRNSKDTLSATNKINRSNVNIIQNNNIKNSNGTNYIWGWLFPDSLIESVVEDTDIYDIYPYSKIYQKYNINNDSSLCISGDTLIIYYRPKTVNYNDSYYHTIFKITKQQGLVSYSRYYSYYGWGFKEKYILNNCSNVLEEKINISQFVLFQNYPNPFNGSTIIKYYINTPSNVIINLYNIRGQIIKSLVDKYHKPGEYNIVINSDDLASGIYIYKLITNSQSKANTMLILK